MKKRVNSSLVLLALCMQYGAGKVVAEQGSLSVTQINPIEKSNITGRLMVLQNKVSVASDAQLDSFENLLHKIGSVLDNRDKKIYGKAENIVEKRKHLAKKFNTTIESLRGESLSKKDLGAISDYIDKMSSASKK